MRRLKGPDAPMDPLAGRREDVRHKKRARRRFNAACLFLLCCCAAAAAVSWSQLAPWYGEWEYENRRDYLDLPEITGPSYIEITVSYDGKRPEDVRVEKEGIRTGSPDITEKPGELVIGTDIGPDAVGDGYRLSLVPLDNKELRYSVEVQPSYRYLDADVAFCTDESGRLWLYVTASYPRLAEGAQGIRATLSLEGKRYLPTVYDGWLENGGALELCVTEAMSAKKIAVDAAPRARLVLSAKCEGRAGEESWANMKWTQDLAQWPAFGPDDGDRPFDMAQTDAYLVSVGKKKPAPDEAPGGTEE